MRKNLTELVFILDASGSMAGLADDTIGGFNGMIQRQLDVPGEALVSTVTFSNESRVLHDRVDIKRVPKLSRQNYCPNGGTALLDAVGDAVHHIDNVHKYARSEDVPEHTMFVITTDGMENASRRYTGDRVREMVRRQQEKYGWEFLFLGANIDAAEAAANIGIAPERAAQYRPDKVGTQLNYDAMDGAVSAMRMNAPLRADWKKRIEEDQKRKK